MSKVNRPPLSIARLVSLKYSMICTVGTGTDIRVPSTLYLQID